MSKYEFAVDLFKDVPSTTGLKWDNARKMLEIVANTQSSPWSDEQIRRLQTVASSKGGEIQVDLLLEWIFQEESAAELMAFASGSSPMGSSVGSKAQLAGAWSQGGYPVPAGPLGSAETAESRWGSDWTCPACNFLNFARNTVCKKCGSAKDGTPDPNRFIIPVPAIAAGKAKASDATLGKLGITPKAGGAVPMTPGPIDASADPTKKAQAQLAAAFAAIQSGKKEEGAEDDGKAEGGGASSKLQLKLPGGPQAGAIGKLGIAAKAGKIGIPPKASGGAPASEAEPTLKLKLPWDTSKEIIVGKPSNDDEERPPKAFRAGSGGKGSKGSMLADPEFESLMAATVGDAFMASALSNAGCQDVNIAFVKSVHPDQGYSLLSINPTSDDFETILVPNTVASPETLQNEVAVAFKPQRNGKGQMQAAAPVWLLKGNVEGDSILWGLHTGTIAKVSAAGDAFISCPEVYNQYGRDAYIYRSVVQACDLEAGDEIQFDIHLSDKGSPQVHAPVWKRYKPGTAAAAMRKGAKGVGKEWHDVDEESQNALHDFGAMAVEIDSASMVVAFVKSASTERGHSVVSVNPEDQMCDEIYVDSSVCSPSVLANETAVAIRPRQNANGRMEASSPIFLVAGRLPGVEPPSEWSEFSGILERITPAGDGLFKSPEVKAKHSLAPFMYKKVLNLCGLKVGDQIQFNVHIDPKGQPLVQAPVWKMYANPKWSR